MNKRNMQYRYVIKYKEHEQFEDGLKHISLKPFTESDVEDSNYRNWFHDEDVTKYNSHGLFPYTNHEMENFLLSLNTGQKIVYAIYAVHVNVNGTEYYNHIGNVSLQSIDMINRSAELAIIIGEKDYWGLGVGEAACKQMLYHGFNKLGLNRIWTGTAKSNIGMRKICTKIGMAHEGTFTEGMWLNGRFEDIYCFGILRNIWLSEGKAYE